MVVKSEAWKDVPGYETRYQVSNLGRVRSFLTSSSWYKHKRLETPRVLIPVKRKAYLAVDLCDGSGTHTRFSVHVLVLTAFEGSRPTENHEAAHLDGNAHNNRLANLKWVLPKENQNHRKIHGNAYASPGEFNGQSKLTSTQVREIRRLLEEGERVKEISKQFNVSVSHINNIKNGVLWAWLEWEKGLEVKKLRQSIREKRIEEIVNRYNAGNISQRELGLEYGITSSQVSRICKAAREAKVAFGRKV